MKLPKDIRDQIRATLWARADEVGWNRLSPTEKARLYEEWTRQDSCGGVLARYMDGGRVRVYIKDSLMKPYARLTTEAEDRIYRILRISPVTVSESFVKPHGRRLADGRTYCWGPANNWKLILCAMHERTFAKNGFTPESVVLLDCAGKYSSADVRAMVEAAARALHIRQLVWS